MEEEEEKEAKEEVEPRVKKVEVRVVEEGERAQEEEQATNAAVEVLGQARHATNVNRPGFKSSMR